MRNKMMNKEKRLWTEQEQNEARSKYWNSYMRTFGFWVVGLIQALLIGLGIPLISTLTDPILIVLVIIAILIIDITVLNIMYKDLYKFIYKKWINDHQFNEQLEDEQDDED